MNRQHSMEPVSGRRFEKITPGELEQHGVYEQCQFIQCAFAQGDLSGLTFRECSFERCDMSLTKLSGTSLQEVRFIDCKLLGVQLSECRKLLLAMNFERCMMKLSVFINLDLKGTAFTGCDLREADFTGANLMASRFEDCDLDQALFFHTNLEKTDLRTAFNFSIPPESNRLKKARFTLQGLPGLLAHHGIEIE